MNSRAGYPTYRISSADPSATWVHLQKYRKTDESVFLCHYVLFILTNVSQKSKKILMYKVWRTAVLSTSVMLSPATTLFISQVEASHCRHGMMPVPTVIGSLYITIISLSINHNIIPPMFRRRTVASHIPSSCISGAISQMIGKDAEYS